MRLFFVVTRAAIRATVIPSHVHIDLNLELVFVNGIHWVGVQTISRFALVRAPKRARSQTISAQKSDANYLGFWTNSQRISRSCWTVNRRILQLQYIGHCACMTACCTATMHFFMVICFLSFCFRNFAKCRFAVMQSVRPRNFSASCQQLPLVFPPKRSNKLCRRDSRVWSQRRQHSSLRCQRLKTANSIDSKQSIPFSEHTNSKAAKLRRSRQEHPEIEQTVRPDETWNEKSSSSSFGSSSHHIECFDLECFFDAWPGVCERWSFRDFLWDDEEEEDEASSSRRCLLPPLRWHNNNRHNEHEKSSTTAIRGQKRYDMIWSDMICYVIVAADWLHVMSSFSAAASQTSIFLFFTITLIAFGNTR